MKKSRLSPIGCRYPNRRKENDMTVRERLIEILSQPIFPKIGVDPAEVVADYLLDNGVIVPPVKIGQTNKRSKGVNVWTIQEK